MCSNITLVNRRIIQMDIPDLVEYPKARSDEYEKYTYEQISRMVKQWLFISDTTLRELDREILGLDASKSKGYEAMNVLHYLGLGPVFKGVFQGFDLDTVINELSRNHQDFTNIIGYLAWEEKNLDFKVCYKLVLIGNARDRNFSKNLRKLLKCDESIVEISEVDLFRKEQAALKIILFGTSTEIQCAICLRSFPLDLMEVTHIKPRSHCSELERLDLSVIMPVCKIGCDSFYKNNYVIIDDLGRIGMSEYKLLPTDLLSVLKNLEGNDCPYFSDATQEYFSYTRRLFEHSGQLKFV